MKRSLKSKVILSYLAVALITVLVVSALIRLTSGQSLLNLVVEQQTAALSESVISYYDSNGNLTGFAEYYFLSLRAQPPEYQPGIPDDRFEPRDIRRQAFALLVRPEQVCAHVVKGTGQLPDLILRGDWYLLVKLPLCQCL